MDLKVGEVWDQYDGLTMSDTNPFTWLARPYLDLTSLAQGRVQISYHSILNLCRPHHEFFIFLTFHAKNNFPHSPAMERGYLT